LHSNKSHGIRRKEGILRPGNEQLKEAPTDVDIIDVSDYNPPYVNDFKYENKHFEINKITAYSVISFNKLKKLVEDKQTKRGEYKALERGAQIIKRKLKNTLLKKHTIKNDKRRKE